MGGRHAMLGRSGSLTGLWCYGCWRWTVAPACVTLPTLFLEPPTAQPEVMAGSAGRSKRLDWGSATVAPLETPERAVHLEWKLGLPVLTEGSSGVGPADGPAATAAAAAADCAAARSSTRISDPKTQSTPERYTHCNPSNAASATSVTAEGSVTFRRTSCVGSIAVLHWQHLPPLLR
ncbi:hypothetical protein VDGL01_06867 [Verticillium dahliae]